MNLIFRWKNQSAKIVKTTLERDPAGDCNQPDIKTHSAAMVIKLFLPWDRQTDQWKK